MSKKISVKTVDYTMTATVVVERNGELSIENIELEECTSKSKRDGMRHIHNIYDEFATVVAVRNMAFQRVEHVANFVIDASNAEIVDACMTAGLTVLDADAPTDESDNA